MEWESPLVSPFKVTSQTTIIQQKILCLTHKRLWAHTETSESRCMAASREAWQDRQGCRCRMLPTMAPADKRLHSHGSLEGQKQHSWIAGSNWTKPCYDTMWRSGSNSLAATITNEVKPWTCDQPPPRTYTGDTLDSTIWLAPSGYEEATLGTHRLRVPLPATSVLPWDGRYPVTKVTWIQEDSLLGEDNTAP